VDPKRADRGISNRGVDNRLGGPPTTLEPRDIQAIGQIPVRVRKWPEPLPQANYIDRVAESVSLDGATGTYLVHWSSGGRRYSARVPDEWILREHDWRTAFDASAIYRTRQAALEAQVPRILAGGSRAYIGFWTNADIPVIVPTLFSDVSTPRIMALVEAKDEDMRQAAREAEEQLRGLARGMLVGRALGLTYQAVRDPKFIGYRLLDSKTGRGLPVATPTPAAPRTPATAERPGSSSGTAPPAAGATSSTAAPASGTPTRTRPPTPGDTTSSKAPLSELLPGYRTAPGEVLGTVAPPASEVATTVVGRERESMLPTVLFYRFPNSQIRFNFRVGPDAEWVGGQDPGFDIADLKPMATAPDYKNYYEFVQQVREWSSKGWANREAPKTFRAAMISYDPQGNFYIETVIVVGPNYRTPLEQLNRPPKPTK
jgi:hypothetical protein